MSKTCTKCGASKPKSDFYSRGAQCKSCICLRVKAYRDANIDRVREYDRNRPNAKMRSNSCVERNRKKYHSDPEFKASALKSRASWKKNNRIKRNAHVIVGNAISAGKLVRQPCEVCQTTNAVHAHHEDYSAPLEVRWLCRTHHAARHKELNEIERSK